MADVSLSALTISQATGIAATLTLPAAQDKFHYIARIEIELYATAARTGGATPLLVTTTNIPGSVAFVFETAQAIGTVIRRSLDFPQPLKSSAPSVATTFVAPVAVTGIWRITAFYYMDT